MIFRWIHVVNVIIIYTYRESFKAVARDTKEGDTDPVIKIKTIGMGWDSKGMNCRLYVDSNYLFPQLKGLCYQFKD